MLPLLPEDVQGFDALVAATLERFGIAGAAVAVIDDGVQTLHPEFTSHGDLVYVSDWQGNVVRVYDAETFEMIAELGDVTTPTGIFKTSRRDETLGH